MKTDSDIVKALRDEKLRASIAAGIHPYLLRNKIQDQVRLASWQHFSMFLAKIMKQHRLLKKERLE